MSTRLNIVVPQDLKWKLELRARLEHLTLSEVVRKAADKYLALDDGLWPEEVADISDLFPFCEGSPDASMTVDEAVYGVGKPR